MNKTAPHSRNGAALVVVLGFLAILTVMIIAFTAQTRSGRLAGRSFLIDAQNHHLLQVALATAVESIDAETSPGIFPAFGSIYSQDPEGGTLENALSFKVEEAYLPLANELVETAFESAKSNASWEQIVSNDGTPLGRTGFIVINTSGLLDANSVGGLTAGGRLKPRGAGTDPSEIRLSRNSALINEFNTSAAGFPHYDPASPGGTVKTADPVDLSPGWAFLYNRSNAWKQFETLRDLSMLNRLGSPLIFTTDIESFCTFSYDQATDPRSFMGTNSASLNEPLIENELAEIGAAEPEFVLNQLRDYLDIDTLPQDENGNYTDLSVEPVPMINEMALNCTFTFVPLFEIVDDEVQVTSVTVSNSFTLEAETWYPFVGYTNQTAHTLNIDSPPVSGMDTELFGALTDWVTQEEIPAGENEPGLDPYNFTVTEGREETSVTSADELVELFADMASDIQFSSIYMVDQTGKPTDQVIDLELPMSTAITNDLMTELEPLSKELFDPDAAQDTTLQLTAGMACIDPRLNWAGTDASQWQEETGLGDGIDTLGEINRSAVDSPASPDKREIMYVRNADRIDSPWELTYLLYNSSNPWKTFQMLEANDDENTRQILEDLSPFPAGPSKSGRVNPYSTHTNVVASLFMDMPINEFNGSPILRIQAAEAVDAAELFMEHVSADGWSANAAEAADDYTTTELEALFGSDNPWVQESFFRNTRELFNPRDTLYTLLLAAQSGNDTNGDGIISDNEVRATKQAIAYLWRDPLTGKSAIVFWGLTDTLRSSTGTRETWADLLGDFAP